MSGYKMKPEEPMPQQVLRPEEEQTLAQGSGLLQQPVQQTGTAQTDLLQEPTQQMANQQAGNQQQVQQAPVSEVELLLRNMEGMTQLTPSTVDVRKLGSAQATAKAEKPSFWYRLTHGWIGKKKVARLSKEERRETRSDVQRMSVKERVHAIATDFSENQDVKQSAEFQEILSKIKDYSAADVTAAEGNESVSQERELYGEICKDLEGFIQNGLYGDSVDMANMASRLYTFFALQKQGELKVPAEKPGVTVLKDTLRPAVMGKEKTFANGEKVYMEDTATRAWIQEKDVSDQQLFSHEPSINDIRQGRLGDCYFLAALSSVVDNDPQIIKDCMKDNGDTVTVRFYKKGDDGQYNPIYVNAKKVIPVYQGKKGQEDLFSNGALWVQMMERAYAIAVNQLRGKDRYGNKVNEQENERARKHWELWQKQRSAVRDPAKQADYDAALERAKEDPTCAFMFDEAGNFIEDYHRITDDPSFSDMEGGRSYLVFQAILGKDATQQVIQRDESGWIIRNSLQNFRDRYGADARHIENTEEGNQQILKEAILEALRQDPLLAGTPVPDTFLDRVTDMKSVYSQMLTVMRRCGKSIHDKREADQPVVLQDEIDSAIQASFGFYAEVELRPEDMQNPDYVNMLAMKKVNDIMAQMMQGLDTVYPTHAPASKYEDEDLALYDQIKDSLGRGDLVNASAKVKKGQKNQKGLNGETESAGFYQRHAYTVLGVEERDIELADGNSRKCRFVKLRNPWGEGVAQYDVKNGELHSSANEKGKEGFFLVELQDFINRFDMLHIVSTGTA